MDMSRYPCQNQRFWREKEKEVSLVPKPPHFILTTFNSRISVLHLGNIVWYGEMEVSGVLSLHMFTCAQCYSWPVGHMPSPIDTGIKEINKLKWK